MSSVRFSGNLPVRYLTAGADNCKQWIWHPCDVINKYGSINGAAKTNCKVHHDHILPDSSLGTNIKAVEEDKYLVANK